MTIHKTPALAIRLIILALTAAAVSTSCFAASFDCAKARSKVEKAVCGDQELSKLDEALAAAYKAALSLHPLPSYVRASQRDWLRILPYVDPNHFASRLKEEYGARIVHLQNAVSVSVFTDSEDCKSCATPFDIEDTVAELWKTKSAVRITIWGGFHLTHALEALFGCEFDGTISLPLDEAGSNLAVDKDGHRLAFTLSRNNLRLEDPEQLCSGFGRIHGDVLSRVVK